MYEGEETVTLQMTDPVAAVMEFPHIAMVTILDPEDGRLSIFMLAFEEEMAYCFTHVNRCVCLLVGQ